ncbi:MAG: hypothetical protein ACI3W8_07440 [Oscillospiraceae bacterium]
MIYQPLSSQNLRHNCREKIYPDGSVAVILSNRQVFREPGWEEQRKSYILPEEPEDYMDGFSVRKAEQSEARAKRRAKNAVRDIARCNDFRWFVTLTLDAEKIDRYDVAAITKRLNQWLDNRVRRCGLAYALVPERHKDGAVHFHGFFNDALETTDSGTISLPGSKKPRRPRSAKQREEWLHNGGHAVFNLPAWDYGFTTAIELYGEREAAVTYVSKYISKAGERVGGRWYYSGGALRRPDVGFTDGDMEDYLAMADAVFFDEDFGAYLMDCPDMPGVQFLFFRREQ